MDNQIINQKCRLKIEEILDKYFGIIAQDETIEQLDEKYPINLPELLIAEYKAFLQTIINEEKGIQVSIDSLLNAHIFSLVSADKYKQEYELYHKKAHDITFFEKITNTNQNDVMKYKYALYKYTETILYSMKDDFMFDLK